MILGFFHGFFSMFFSMFFLHLLPCSPVKPQGRGAGRGVYGPGGKGRGKGLAQRARTAAVP